MLSFVQIMHPFIVLFFATCLVRSNHADPSPQSPGLRKKLAEVNPAHSHEGRVAGSPMPLGLGLPASSPEENKKRLAELADQMDADQNGSIDQDELQQWIEKCQKKYWARELEKQWKTHNPSGMSRLSWDEYRLATYGFLDNAESGISDRDRVTYERMLRRDRRRWALADQDGDNLLTKEEFVFLLHPERSPRMRDLVVEETLEDIDKDGDGRVSLVEYIRDLYQPDEEERNKITEEASEEEPEWVRSERTHFKNDRDLNQDGYLDRAEVKEWLSPAHTHTEAQQLIQEADQDDDGKLSKQEVLDSYDLFVSSEATEYGEALTPINHDEL